MCRLMAYVGPPVLVAGNFLRHRSTDLGSKLLLGAVVTSANARRQLQMLQRTDEKKPKRYCELHGYLAMNLQNPALSP